MSNPISGLPRRSFLGMAGAGLGAAALAACGGPTTDTPNSGSSSASGIDYSGVKPAAEISMWSNHPGKSQDITQEFINKFQQANPGIKVNLVTAGSNYEEVAQKFQTAQAANDPKQLPDIIVLSDVWWFRYFINDAIIPLDGLIKTLQFQVDDFRKTLWNDYQYKGQQWAVPWARSTPLFYYNKDMFKAAGLPDAAPKTWDEYAEMAPKLKSSNPSALAVHMLPSVGDYDSWSLQNRIWGWGGSYSKDFDITCDSDEVVKAMSFMQDWVYKSKFAAVSSKAADADFAAGAAACFIGSTGSLVGILSAAKFGVGAAFLPGGPVNKDMVCPTGGAGLGIPKAITPERQLAAGMFLKFLTEPANTAAFSTATGYMPVRTSAKIDDVIAKRPQAQVALDQLAHTKTQDFARVFLPGGDREIGVAANEIYTQQADPKTRMTKLKGTLTDIYTKEVKPKLK